MRQGTTYLVAEHGAAAVTDLAENLAANQAEAFEALSAAEDRPALAVLSGWFHDVPPPRGPAPAEPLATEPGEDLRGRNEREKPTGEAPS